MLKRKHMIFGYELSFLNSTLKKIHKKAGFEKIEVGKFRCRLFWPMIKVTAKKQEILSK